MNKQKRVMILLGFVFLCFLIYCAINHFYKVKEVYFVNETINSFEAIDVAKVEKRKIPAWLYQEGMVSAEKELLEKYVGINTTLYPNMIIDKVMLMSKKERDNFSKYRLNDQEVIFSLSSDQLKNLRGLLMIDQCVDLYVSIPLRNQSPIVDWLMKNVKIVGLKNKQGKEITNVDDEVVYLINLAVEKQYLTYLIKALRLGEIQLYVANVQTDEMTFNQESKLMDHLS